MVAFGDAELFRPDCWGLEPSWARLKKLLLAAMIPRKASPPRLRIATINNRFDCLLLNSWLASAFTGLLKLFSDSSWFRRFLLVSEILLKELWSDSLFVFMAGVNRSNVVA